MIEIVVVDPERLPVDDGSHIRRQLVTLGHGGAGDEQRHDLELEAERGGDLRAQRVLGIVEAAVAGGVPFEPSPADQDDGHLAGPERLPDHLGPAGAEVDAGHVHEDAAGKALVQPVVQTSGVPRRILAAVTHKDFAGGHLMSSDRS